MYCRCSHCEFQQQVATEQLRSLRGLVICIDCGARFDALATLSDQPEGDFMLPRLNAPKLARNGFSWTAGLSLFACGLMLVLFVAQVLYFEGDTLRYQSRFRPLWLAVCQRMGCDTPAKAQIEDWSVSHSDLRPYLNRQLLFTAALTYQGAHSQPFPSLQLTLVGVDGEVLAQRTFSGSEYANQLQIPAGGTQNIQLWLAESPKGFSGFYVSLL